MQTNSGFATWCSNGEINISFPTIDIGGTLSLFSIEGKEIASFKVEESTTKLSTANFLKGIYFVSWKKTDGNIITKKIIID